jgi:hypothetical protein
VTCVLLIDRWWLDSAYGAVRLPALRNSIRHTNVGAGPDSRAVDFVGAASIREAFAVRLDVRLRSKAQHAARAPSPCAVKSFRALRESFLWNRSKSALAFPSAWDSQRTSCSRTAPTDHRGSGAPAKQRSALQARRRNRKSSPVRSFVKLRREACASN